MKGNSVAVLGALLLTFSSGLAAQDQSDSTSAKRIDYKLGQVWTMSQGITVTIVAVDDVRKVGRVVHVRVDNIPWQECGKIHLTRTIEHVAVTEKMLMKSTLVLSKENVDVPQSSIEAYRTWQGEKKHEIAKVALPTLIRAQGQAPAPMICNVLPNLT